MLDGEQQNDLYQHLHYVELISSYSPTAGDLSSTNDVIHEQLFLPLHDLSHAYMNYQKCNLHKYLQSATGQ